ncbi:MAG: MopE-related protein, partial [Candidatus Calescibacterium sp.]
MRRRKNFGGLFFLLVGIAVVFGLSSTGCGKKSSQTGKTEEKCPVWFKDSDKDGYTDGTTKVSCEKPSDEYVSSATPGDCDDNAPNINPARVEICDGLDNNCNGQIDEGVLLVFYRDQDGDGYGYANNSTQACSQPEGYVSNASDCDDNNANLHPNTIWFKDADSDGFYPTGGSSVSCNNPFAPNNATYVAIPGGDCDDDDASIYPGAPLNCNNGKDNDCSGNIETWAYTDADGDRYAPNNISYCVDVVSFPGQITVGIALGTNDCDDNNANINPNTIWFKDADLDGYYPAGGSQVSCTDPYPENSTYLAIPGGDCDDNNASIYPGAPLNCNNGQDNDCSGNIETWAYTDQDGDRYAPNNISYCVDVVSFPGQIPVGLALGTDDCDDNDASIYPGAPLNCDNEQDNDCSGNIETWVYTDADGDLFAPDPTSYCVDVVSFPGQIPVEIAFGTNDCDDSNPSINPFAPDNTCDGIDNNCNLYVDENTAPCFAPTSFGIYSWGLTYVSLSWSYPEPSSNVEKFVIQRSPNGITYVDVAEVPASATNYTIRTYLTSKYYFRVYAKNATGSGSPSSVTSAPIGVNSLFEKTIGGSLTDIAFSIIQSSDGYYVVAGRTSSFGAGGWDMYLVAITADGNVLVTKTIGG